MTRFAAILLAAAVLAPAAVARAADEGPTSAYTKFNADTCPHVEGTDEEDYGTWTCPGFAGIDVVLRAGDQRMFVSFGEIPGDDVASSQTFPGFNDAYSGTVEWRREASGRPFATILRWNVMLASDQSEAGAPSTPGGRVLVVTRLGPGGVCHVGYVDGRANPDANVLARQLADEHARTFDCGNDRPIVLGRVMPGLAMPD